MRAGRLRDRIVLQAKVVTRDAMGGEVITWTDQATVWAEPVPLAGREYTSANQEQSEISVRFRLRYRADLAVTAAWRVTWNSVAYDILDVINVRGTKREWELMCRTAPT